MKTLFARKPLHLLLEEMNGDDRLHRILGPFSLTALGVGCIIGAGIFVITGQVARTLTGPSLILSFVVAGVACVFAALCYAEFASLVPVAGSAYTYAYATMGELFAWIIGWDLVLEYTVASAAVAHSWSKHFQELLSDLRLHVPFSLSQAPIYVPEHSNHLTASGASFDLLAILITAVITIVLVKGIKESAHSNAAIVVLKVAVVLFVVVVGAFYVDPKNWANFAPFGYGGISIWGMPLFGSKAAVGTMAGAALVFFAYIGFDSVSTHAEEAKNPQRDVPVGIITSLVICTLLYIAVAAVLTGMVPYDQIDKNAGVAAAFRQVGLGWAHFIISIGAVAGITSVLLVLMLSQPRVLLAMARDGLLPVGFFGAVHPRFRTPWKATILTGVLVAIMAGLLPLDILAELVNIGTLLAFVIVCLAVLIMRRRHPEAKRAFRCPFVPAVPLMGIALCLLLMLSLPLHNWIRLGVWLLAGFVIYFTYSRRHSILVKQRVTSESQDSAPTG